MQPPARLQGVHAVPLRAAEPQIPDRCPLRAPGVEAAGEPSEASLPRALSRLRVPI